MPAPFQSVYGLPKGCIGTDLDATASNVLAVPSNFFGGQYHTSASLLWTNSVLQNCAGFNIFGITLAAATTAARTISFFGSKGDKSNYDVALNNVLTGNADAGRAYFNEKDGKFALARYLGG